MSGTEVSSQDMSRQFKSLSMFTYNQLFVELEDSLKL